MSSIKNNEDLAKQDRLRAKVNSDLKLVNSNSILTCTSGDLVLPLGWAADILGIDIEINLALLDEIFESINDYKKLPNRTFKMNNYKITLAL